jgi:hypothetical protein
MAESLRFRSATFLRSSDPSQYVLPASGINLLLSFRSQHHVMGALVVLVEAMAADDAVQVGNVHAFFVRCVGQEHNVLFPAIWAIRAERMVGIHSNSPIRALAAGVLPTTSTSAALSTTRGTLGSGAGFTNGHYSATELSSIQFCNSLIGIARIRHLHEREPAWVARIIFHDIHLIHRTMHGE